MDVHSLSVLRSNHLDHTTGDQVTKSDQTRSQRRMGTKSKNYRGGDNNIWTKHKVRVGNTKTTSKGE